MNRKKKVLISSLLIALLAGAAIVYAYFTAGDIANNIFKLGNRYTLTYHANTGSEAEDVKVTNVPEQQKAYGNGSDPVEFTVSTEKPVRPGFVFKGWYEKTSPASDDTKYGGDGGENTYTAEAEQKESHLYAQWAAGFTLIYDANRPDGAKGGDAPEAVTRESDGTSETFNVSGPGQMDWIITIGEGDDAEETNEYRVFLGWSEDPQADVPTYTDTGKWAYTGTDYDGDNTGDTEKTITVTDSDPNSTKTLYAVWANRYVLEYKPHPDMKNPAVGNTFPQTQTRVTRSATHGFRIPDESSDIRPTRGGGYEWGWWGDNIERFGYSEEAPTSAPVNEGCYLFGEPIRALDKDSPKQVLYAYFQPPNEVKINYDRNTTRSNMPATSDQNAKVENLPTPDYGYVTGEIYYYPVGGLSALVPKHPRYVFQGWATTPDATVKEYDPGDETFKANIILNNEVTLYAVWKAGHNYRLYFNLNGGGRIYYKDNGDWKNSSSNISYNSDDPNGFNDAPTQFFTEPSYTWNKDFFGSHGLFATRSDTNSTSGAWTYKFLGWSDKRQDPNINPEDLTIDYPVTPPGPADPDNPNPLNPDISGITGDIGLITEAITAEEPNTSCTTPTTHSVTYYAVWQKSPKHQLALVFNKGAASNNISNGTYYAPSSNGYVASVDLLEKEWTAENLKNLTVPYKSEDDTATYEFIGWSDKNLPGGVGTEDDVDISVDPETKKINQSVKVKEPKENPRECDGGRHTDNYYPVFKKTARHKFVVNYDVNAPSTANTVETHVYTSDDGNNWTKKKVKGGSPATGDINATGNLVSKTQALTEPDYTYQLNGKGWFMTCVNTSPNSTSNYTFLGWSTVKHELGTFDPTKLDEGEVYFSVTAPSDPENPGSGEGTLSGDLEINEENENPQCSIDDNMGYVHERTLYGVWAGEPLHQFSVVFVADADDAPNQKIVHGSKQNWKDGGDALARSSETIAKDEEDFKGTPLDADDDGKLDDAVSNTWRAYSDALRMPKENTNPEYSKSYTFDNNFWGEDGRDLIVTAEAGDSNEMRYEFDGWYTEPNGQGTKIEVDDDGYFTTPLSITSDEYPCDSKTHHIVLYAKWKKTKIHNFQIVFYANGGNSIGYRDGANWRSNNINYVPGYSSSLKKTDIVGIMNPEDVPDTMNYTGRVSSPKDVASTFDSYTWKTTDNKPLRLEATHNNTNESGTQYKWIFKGWGESKDGPVKYSVDSSSYLTSDVEVQAPHSGSEDCESYTHTKVLYAIWEKEEIPKQHRYALTFHLNSGSNFRIYDNTSGTWVDGANSNQTMYDTANGAYSDISPSVDSYTWTQADLNAKGLGGAKRNSDARWNYEFVGWSTKQLSASEDPDMSNAIGWSHDDVKGTEAGDGFVADALTASCSDSTANHNSQQTTHTKTVYAIWKRTPRSKTYTLKFEGNGGEGIAVTGVPSDMTGTETFDSNNPAKWNTHSFDLSDTSRPVNRELIFAGWSEDKDASKGVYGTPYNGPDDDQKRLTENLVPLFTTSPAVADNVTEVEKKLYAIWLYEYRITYNANAIDGYGAPPHMHAYDKKDKKSTQLRDVEPMREGYTFVEWNTQSDGNGESFNPGQQITMEAEENGKKMITLYAIWQQN